MRLLYLGNNRLGAQILPWLVEQGEEIVGLVLHEEGKRKNGAELLAAAKLPPERIFPGVALKEPATLEAIQALGAEMALSILFDYILRPPFLSLFPKRVVNLHPSLLPWNRGQYPNVWSIIEGTPAGTTLHYIDAGIDTGEILAQREIAIEPVDTGESLYRKLEQASFDLFRECWPALKAGTLPPLAQSREAGTVHRARDVDAIDRIDPERSYTGRELINILRARTFPPYRGAYMLEGGRRIELRLGLEYGKE